MAVGPCGAAPAAAASTETEVHLAGLLSEAVKPLSTAVSVAGSSAIPLTVDSAAVARATVATTGPPVVEAVTPAAAGLTPETAAGTTARRELQVVEAATPKVALCVIPGSTMETDSSLSAPSYCVY